MHIDHIYLYMHIYIYVYRHLNIYIYIHMYMYVVYYSIIYICIHVFFKKEMAGSRRTGGLLPGFPTRNMDLGGPYPE